MNDWHDDAGLAAHEYDMMLFEQDLQEFKLEPTESGTKETQDEQAIAGVR